MTRSDREQIRGWQHAMRDMPPDPYSTKDYEEGYAIGLATVRSKRITKALQNIRIPVVRH